MENNVLEMLQDGMPLKSIAIDSVKSIRYPGDHKKKTTDITMGGSGAKYLGPALKGLLPIIREFDITTLLVQQVYEELDQYKAMRNPYKLPDGRSLKHFCDYMLQVEKLETKKGIIEDGKSMTGSANQIGHKVRVKAKKNRCGAPYRVAEFSLEYEKGIVNTAAELFELAKSLGIVFHPISESTGKVNNVYWQFGNHEKIKGEDNTIEWVINNKNIQDEIYQAIMGSGSEADDARNKLMEEDSEVNVNLDEL